MGELTVDERVLRVGVDIVDLRVVVERVGVLLLLMLLREGVVPMPLVVVEREVVPLLFTALLREELEPVVLRWYTLEDRFADERVVEVALLGRPTSLLRVDVLPLVMVRPVLESITLPVERSTIRVRDVPVPLRMPDALRVLLAVRAERVTPDVRLDAARLLRPLVLAMLERPEAAPL